MPHWQILLSAFVCVVNVFGVFLIWLDKKKAQKNKRRIAEKVLFLLAFLGGCPGMYGCMQIIRHKTKHRRFMIGLPLIFAAQLLAIVLCVIYF